MTLHGSEHLLLHGSDCHLLLHGLECHCAIAWLGVSLATACHRVSLYYCMALTVNVLLHGFENWIPDMEALLFPPHDASELDHSRNLQKVAVGPRSLKDMERRCVMQIQ